VHCSRNGKSLQARRDAKSYANLISSVSEDAEWYLHMLIGSATRFKNMRLRALKMTASAAIRTPHAKDFATDGRCTIVQIPGDGLDN
jgi:hypothetical protein